jgi:hypothetical protein
MHCTVKKLHATQKGITSIMATMRADKNAAEFEKKATKVLHPDPRGNDELFDPSNLQAQLGSSSVGQLMRRMPSIHRCVASNRS